MSIGGARVLWLFVYVVMCGCFLVFVCVCVCMCACAGVCASVGASVCVREADISPQVHGTTPHVSIVRKAPT